MRRLTSFLSLCTLMPALMLSAPGTAVASHDGTRNGGDVASLVAAVAEANQRMADMMEAHEDHMVFARKVLEQKAKADERFARRFQQIVEKHDKNLYGA